MILRLFQRSPNRELIDRLSGEIVAAARQPALFAGYGIEDSVEGRFEALALHAFLILSRLKQMPPPAPAIAQDLTDAFFRGFDAAMRENGVGDLSVPKHMKTLAAAFCGRVAAYERALQNGAASLAAALSRNVYAGRGQPDEAARLARYVVTARSALAEATLSSLISGKPPFPDLSSIL
ncbi:MAG TPA: ubiquinol-cytochrome C chaperone family protein [Methylocella sp.]|nr:ubiquinol-cytochrome C chaperone family protein [Methylocella sp.]